MRIFLILFAFLLSFSLSMGQAFSAQTTPASHAILIDANTGTVLLEKNANKRMPTSSMSKVMTIYMIFDALKEGRLSLSDTMPVSEKAWRKGGSKMFVALGSNIKVEDLIRGIVIQSGNDATIVVAEGLSGSEDAFAQTMTQRAHDLGMNNTQLKNASGWPDPDHYSTARDLALLSYKLIKNFPEYYHYFGEKKFKYNDIEQMNRNVLLFRNMGVDGLKTGHTQAGGYGLMSSAERAGRRLILVVNGLKSDKSRADESARLLEWGFNAFENVSLFEAGETLDHADVALGLLPQVSLVVAKNIKVLLPKSRKHELKVSMRYQTPIAAPVAKGEKVGTLTVEVPGQPKQTYDILTGSDVLELGLIPKTMAKARFFLMGAY